MYTYFLVRRPIAAETEQVNNNIAYTLICKWRRRMTIENNFLVALFHRNIKLFIFDLFSGHTPIVSSIKT